MCVRKNIDASIMVVLTSVSLLSSSVTFCSLCACMCVSIFLCVCTNVKRNNNNSDTQELRAGRYAKVLSQSADVVNTVYALGLNSSNNVDAVTNGVTLLPPPTVSALLQDRRQDHLVHPLRLALLKLASQEV